MQQAYHLVGRSFFSRKVMCITLLFNVIGAVASITTIIMFVIYVYEHHIEKK